jgi:2,5-diamino-6-(ribosylamino)-4(3H)-pyrimidinone 5'-phosphate reductase
MDRPRVTIHNLISLDGRLDGFGADIGLYYELAGTFPQDAVLTTSTTLLAAAAADGIEMTGEDAVTGVPLSDESLPWLVIVDSRGQLVRLNWLRSQPFWRDVLVLCSPITPVEHLDRLRRHHVTHLVTGADRVDLADALHQLADWFGVATVRVDAGGTLNGILLRTGLVDELSVVIAPHLVGTAAAHARHLVDGFATPDPATLTPTSVEQLRDGHVWLRYKVGNRCSTNPSNT